MSMPPQLKAGLLRRRQYPRREPKPIAETLPTLDVNELLRAIPHKHGITRTQSFNSPSHPQPISLRLTCEAIEVTHPTGHVQTFRLKWIRTNFGHPRPAIHCDRCQRPVLKLYNRYNDLCCRRCRGAIRLSQKLDKHTRPVLKAHRLDVFLGLKSNVRQATRERLIKRFGEKAMMPTSNYGSYGPRHWK